MTGPSVHDRKATVTGEPRTAKKPKGAKGAVLRAEAEGWSVLKGA